MKSVYGWDNVWQDKKWVRYNPKMKKRRSPLIVELIYGTDQFGTDRKSFTFWSMNERDAFLEGVEEAFGRESLTVIGSGFESFSLIDKYDTWADYSKANPQEE